MLISVDHKSTFSFSTFFFIRCFSWHTASIKPKGLFTPCDPVTVTNIQLILPVKRSKPHVKVTVTLTESFSVDEQVWKNHSLNPSCSSFFQCGEGVTRRYAENQRSESEAAEVSGADREAERDRLQQRGAGETDRSSAPATRL